MDEVNNNDINQTNINKLKQDELKSEILHYRNVVNYLGANVPIEVLCLPNEIENILIKSGYIRVYDLIGKNLAKIKGIGEARIGILTARLDEFFVVSI